MNRNNRSDRVDHEIKSKYKTHLHFALVSQCKSRLWWWRRCNMSNSSVNRWLNNSSHNGRGCHETGHVANFWGSKFGRTKLQCLEPQRHFQMRAKTNWYKPNSRKTLAFRLDVYNVFGGQIRSRKFNKYWSFEDVTLRHVWQEKTNNMILVRTIKVARMAKNNSCSCSCFQWCFMVQTLFFKTYTQPKPSCGISVCLSFINTNYV